MSTDNAGEGLVKHHPDCPVNYWTDKPERCRCVFMAMIDKRAERPATSAEAEGPCGDCGRPLTEDAGYTGWVAYHRTCARRVYGDTFEETPAEPDDGGADGLAKVCVLGRSYPLGMEAARAILASDWLATREREAEQRGAEKAGERIARAIEAERDGNGYGLNWPGLDYAALIARADATRSR